MAKISKILYIVTQSEFGGAQKYVHDLASEFKGQFEVAVAAGKSESHDTQLLQSLQEKRIQCFALKHIVRPIHPIHDILGIFEIYSLCKKFRPDVVHLNSSKVSILGSIAARMARVPKIVHTIHGFAFDENISWLKKTIYTVAEKITAKCKDDFIFLSQKDKRSGDLKKIFPKHQSWVIYNGIDTENMIFESRERAREILHIPKDAFVFGAIANLYKTKGINFFIQAAAIAQKNTERKIIFSVIGEGKERAELESLIQKHNLQNTFFLLGKIDNASRLLRSFDVFVVSSTKEGLPFAVLEAMAAGLGVLSTKVGALEEIFSDQKEMLVEPKNPQALADAFIRIADSHLLRTSSGEKNLHMVREKFSKDVMIEKTLEVYEYSSRSSPPHKGEIERGS